MQANAFPKGANGERDEGVIAETLPKLGLYIEVLNNAVGITGYFAGNSFSLADMYLMPLLAYFRVFPESGGMFARAEHLVRYFANHSSRQSCVTTTPPSLDALRR